MYDACEDARNTNAGASRAAVAARSPIKRRRVVTQTFTVGIAGNLVAVEPFVQANSFGLGSLIVEVFPTSDGTVDHVESATPLVSKSYTDREIYSAFDQGSFGDLYVDFSDMPIPVGVGEQYVISLRTVGFNETGFSWDSDFPDGYPGGGMLIKNQVFNEWRPVFGNGDGTFRTYVSVPEPSSIALALAVVTHHQ